MVYLHTVDINLIYLNSNSLYIFLDIIRLQRLSCLYQPWKCDGRQMRTFFRPSYHCRCADCICSSAATMVYKALCWWYNTLQIHTSVQHWLFPSFHHRLIVLDVTVLLYLCLCVPWKLQKIAVYSGLQGLEVHFVTWLLLKPFEFFYRAQTQGQCTTYHLSTQRFPSSIQESFRRNPNGCNIKFINL